MRIISRVKKFLSGGGEADVANGQIQPQPRPISPERLLLDAIEEEIKAYRAARISIFESAGVDSDQDRGREVHLNNLINELDGGHSFYTDDPAIAEFISQISEVIHPTNTVITAQVTQDDFLNPIYKAIMGLKRTDREKDGIESGLVRDVSEALEKRRDDIILALDCRGTFVAVKESGAYVENVNYRETIGMADTLASLMNHHRLRVIVRVHGYDDFHEGMRYRSIAHYLSANESLREARRILSKRSGEL